MANKKAQFFWFNLVDQVTTVITGANPNAQFPANNLKDKRSTKIYRSTTASDTVTFDFITTEPVDAILVRGHLLSGFGFSVLTIKASATDSAAAWAAPAFSTTLTPNHEHNFGFTSLPSTESYRFWRVEGAGSLFFELADIYIGASFQMERNIGNQFTVENRDLSSFSRNRYHQKFTDILNDKLVIKGNINLLKKDNALYPETLRFFDYVGKHRAFWFILDEDECVVDNNTRYSGKFEFDKKPVPKHAIKGIYNTSVRMEESP